MQIYLDDQLRPKVPESCCYVNLYKNTIEDKEKCQTFQNGPPSKPVGSPNPTVYHKVQLITVEKYGSST